MFNVSLAYNTLSAGAKHYLLVKTLGCHSMSFLLSPSLLLRDRELYSSTPLGITSVCPDLIVFIAEGGEWFEVGVNKEDVSPLNINQGGCRISKTLGGSETHNILNPTVEQFGCHDHTIGLPFVR